ncbi:hypothetical protein KGF86_14490 [Ornithinibacillus massiliensis]|uniref:DUF6199 domain-containing protein n=1 Tax=Ornithinibacillus massiliensis TaxID=1944633 RepID=A0ABS5MHQ8_9BACI|nr:DUF6199 family natural product biosynthesis protein [Ornithinibacillus massiliensis]MBS3681407.1 hypothetical protein [Ornithinibacillus massiliensis]
MEYVLLLTLIVILIVYGLLAILKPEIGWENSEKWKTLDAEEASEAYLWQVRISGVISIFLAVSVLAGILLKIFYFS